MCKGSLQIYIYQLPLHLLTGRMLLKCFAETLVLSDPLKRLCKAAVVCLQGCGGHKPPVQTNKQPKKNPRIAAESRQWRQTLLLLCCNTVGAACRTKSAEAAKTARNPFVPASAAANLVKMKLALTVNCSTLSHRYQNALHEVCGRLSACWLHFFRNITKRHSMQNSKSQCGKRPL